MKISSAEFKRSAQTKANWVPDFMPEIAFLGRSNVGKSSLLNSLVMKKGLARTSNTPGRTQLINFFMINSNCYFVDLPGYGYAKVSKTMREDWGKMAEVYLSTREQLALAIQLIDSRHPPTALDIQLNEWLGSNAIPRVIVATKADKLSNNKLAQSVALIKRTLQNENVLAYSAMTGAGRVQLLEKIEESVKEFRKNG